MRISNKSFKELIIITSLNTGRDGIGMGVERRTDDIGDCRS